MASNNSSNEVVAHRRDVLRWVAGAALLATGGSLTGLARAATKLTPDAKSALIVVDVQNCFMPGGTLPVKEGNDVVGVINRIAPAFENVILTQDWHTPGHASFASAHPGKKPFDSTKLSYGNQVLWPDHCVQGTPDADLQKDLKIPQAQLVIRKGYHKNIDSYSAFYEADRKTATGLSAYLKQHQVKRVFLTGLATDFCVAWTAIDARREGFETYVIEDATRAIDLNGSLAKAWADMKAKGVKRIQSTDLAA
ncbi:MAG: Nicotinamidase [Herminiimonas sp.]|nr:Nicotinamidase [Herminiimonas sp.]